jgi:taspase (threonine aspartase 1)
MSLKRVPPIFLVGPGAKLYASRFHFPTIKNDELVSQGAYQRWLKWRRELDGPRLPSSGQKPSGRSRSKVRRNSDGPGAPATAVSRADPDGTSLSQDDDEDLVTDTVGAVCVDRWGRVAAGSSSGGIGMKFPGRVGPAALIGVGTWIRVDSNGTVVATTCSGIY